jgi:hypothetical protein
MKTTAKKCGLIPLHILSERVAVGWFFKMAAIPQVFFGGEDGGGGGGGSGVRYFYSKY